MDDYQTEDGPCPFCNHPAIHWCACRVVGCDDGWIDMHEYDDPLWYDEGEQEPCRDCRATGIEKWCPKCGRDPREGREVS